ncbi:MAG TPA: hypothetical protein VME42_04945 [Steroidobacteraceae bacterium]|nr:hypothetical protein [Steroidobacteraceae bacterium]
MQPDFPIPIETRALGTLAYIRRSIDASASMAVPGMAGVVMGAIGMLAAILASMPHWASFWLLIWASAGGIAFLVGGALMAREAAQSGHARYLGPVRKFILCLCPALLAGAVLSVVLWHAHMDGLLPGTWLLLYGCAVLSASTVTVASTMRLLCIMGALFVALGSCAFVLPAGSHTAMLGLGFGVLHVVFGLLVGRCAHAE